RAVISVSAAPIHDAQGQIVAGVTAFIDVTAQREIEARLHEREALLSALVEQFPGAVSVVDRDFRYVFASQQRIVSANVPPVEMAGKRIQDLYPPDHIASAVSNISQAFEGKTVQTDEPGDGKVF